MIRPAQFEDIQPLVELGKKTALAIHSRYVMDEAMTKRNLAFLISSKAGFLYVAEKEGEIVGGLAAQASQLWFSRKKYCADLAFIVKPGHPASAVKLIRAYRAWAETVPGVVDITLQQSSGLGEIERFGRLCEKLGFQKMGGCYSILR